MYKERAEHLGAAHYTEKLRVVGDLRDVVRRRRRSTAEAIGRASEELRQLDARLAIHRLEDARLVQHHSIEVAGVKVINHLVIGDRDGCKFVAARVDDFDTELCALTNRLLCYTERRQD